jgi:hypothetical protein
MMACLHADNFKRNFQISKKEYQTWLKKFTATAARSGFIREACFSAVVGQTVVILRKKFLQGRVSEAFYKILFCE